HELPAKALAQRLCCDQCFELACQQAVSTEGEFGVDPFLDRGEPKLLETCDLALRERLVPEGGQRRSPPEPECVTQRVGATLLDEALEPLEIELARLDTNHVARSPRDDAVGADRLAQL